MTRPRKPVQSRTARLPVCAHRVQALRGDAEQPGGQPVGEQVIPRLEAALDTLPGGTAGWERPQARGWDGHAHPNRRRAVSGMPNTGVAPVNGRKLPRCTDAPGDIATTAMTPATCGIDMVSGPSGNLAHNNPDVRRTPPDRQRPPPMGDQIPPSVKRLERHTEKRLIIASEGAVGSAARSSASRARQSRIRP